MEVFVYMGAILFVGWAISFNPKIDWNDMDSNYKRNEDDNTQK